LFSDLITVERIPDAKEQPIDSVRENDIFVRSGVIKSADVYRTVSEIDRHIVQFNARAIRINYPTVRCHSELPLSFLAVSATEDGNGLSNALNCWLCHYSSFS